MLFAGPKLSKPRAILTETQAVRIFAIKHSPASLSIKCSSAAHVSRMYGVNEKTVRDIWKGRTWSRETAHVDSDRPSAPIKASGRPKGCKDSKPRKPCVNGKQSPSCGIKLSRAKCMESSSGYSQSYACPFNSLRNDPRAISQPYWGGADQVVANDQCDLHVTYSKAHQNACDQLLPSQDQIESIDAQLYRWDLFGSSFELQDPFQLEWANALADADQ